MAHVTGNYRPRQIKVRIPSGTDKEELRRRLETLKKPRGLTEVNIRSNPAVRKLYPDNAAEVERVRALISKDLEKNRSPAPSGQNSMTDSEKERVKEVRDLIERDIRSRNKSQPAVEPGFDPGPRFKVDLGEAKKRLLYAGLGQIGGAFLLPEDFSVNRLREVLPHIKYYAFCAEKLGDSSQRQNGRDLLERH